jgi:DNA-binding NtrC family response regulator
MVKGSLPSPQGCGAQEFMATILLVDSNPLQAHQRKSILERRFHEVQRVSDAAEALCLVEQPEFAGNLGLIISGEHMQGIGGPAFVAELHLRMPLLPVLVLGNNGEVASDYAGECVRFLPKPVAGDEMVALAGEMLAQHECEAV